MKTYAPHLRKAQKSPDKYLDASVRIIEGTGRFGAKSKPFNVEEAIDSYRSWIYAAVNINATAVASLPLRLFVRNRGNAAKLWRTRRVDNRRRRYLFGDATGPRGAVHPHKTTMRKIIEFGEDFEEVTDAHPILELIRQVNPWFNGYDLLQLITVYLELTGNAYIHPVINALGVPGELWPMPSQWVFVIPDQETFIDGYVYGNNAGTQMRFEVDEVIQVRTVNPGRDGLYYGMGKPQAAWGVVQLNEAHHEMDLAMAHNHARPDYVMVAKPGTGNDALDRFERKVESKLRGSRQSGSFLSITGDVELMPLNFPPKDMAGREDVVEEISAVFGVPVSMLKANDPNLASAKTGYGQWREATILPLAKLIEQKLNEALLPMFGIEGDAVLAFDNPVPQDEQFELDSHTRLSAGGIMTPNEVREDRGLEPVADPMADKLLINGQPIGQPLASPFTLNMPQQERPQAIVNTSELVTADDLEKVFNDLHMAIATAIASKPQSKVERRPDESFDDCVSRGVGQLMDEGMEQDQAVAAARNMCKADKCDHGKHIKQSDFIWKVSADNDVRDEQPVTPETQLRDAVAGVLDEFGQQIIEMSSKTIAGKYRQKINQGDINRIVERLLNMQAPLEEAVLDPLTAMLTRSFEEGLQEIDVTGFDITNDRAQQFIRSRSTRLAGEITSHTRARVEQILREGVGAGATPQELSQSIQDTGAFSRARANAIARTESADAYVQGKIESWRQSGVVKGKRWDLAPNACEFCRAVAARFNNQQVGLDDAFFRVGDTVQGVEGGTLKVNFRDITGPPLHPNDRCSIRAVLE